MNRAQLEHIIRAAAVIADENDIVIVWSQSILGQFPEAPPSLRVSIEADVYPKNRPDLLISKLVAGRPKDIAFATDAVRSGLARPAVLSERLAATRLDEPIRSRVAGEIRALAL